MRVLYVQYTNPAGYPPLQHSSRILADEGCDVLFLGTGAQGAGTLEFPEHARIQVRRMAFRQAGIRQKLHYAAFCAWVLWTAMVWRPRWVYASDPFSCPAALLLTYLPRIDVIYHEHDSPEEATRPTGVAGVIATARRQVARRAAVCVLPNAERLARFAAALGRLRAQACVWNCPARGEVAQQAKAGPSEVIWLLYHGSIVPDRLPMAVVEALALLPAGVRLRFAGYETVGAKGHVAALLARAKELGLAERVEHLGTIPQREDLLRATATSDIGLALMPLRASDWNCATMTGASNKAFDYLAFGLALVVAELPDWREMFVEPGYGLACDPNEAGSIAGAIRQLIEDPTRMRAMGEAGRQKILSEWNYEQQFRPIAERMLQA